MMNKLSDFFKLNNSTSTTSDSMDTSNTTSNIKVPVFIPEPQSEKNSNENEDEWILVEGYKAVNPNMSARHGNMIYELGKEYVIEDESKIELCYYGYHFCLKPEFIRGYYNYGRLFKVVAEVKKSEYDKMKETGYYNKYSSIPSNIYYNNYPDVRKIDKLVARKIKFIEEITDIKIIKRVWDIEKITFVKNETDWWNFIDFCSKINTDYSDCIYEWIFHNFKIKMTELGFSETFLLALYKKIIHKDKCERVIDLTKGLNDMNVSTDMKVYLLMNEVSNL